MSIPSISRRPPLLTPTATSEAGMKTAAKYGGLEVPEAKRLKGLASENAKLKKLLVDAMLDNAALKDLLAKNV
jgi:hypothetical protein